MSKKRTASELFQASGHLYYEIQMLLGCAQLLADGKYGNPVEEYALIQSFAIHTRNLVHFLYASKEEANSDDVLASDFFDNPDHWSSQIGAKPPELEKAQKRANKEVAHLTYTRQKVKADEKPWPVAQIREAVITGLRLFFRTYPGQKCSRPEVVHTFRGNDSESFFPRHALGFLK